MDAQIERAQDPLHPHSAVEGEGDQHEKKSVLKKVKAKAKKIKNTFGMKSHGHANDNNDDGEDEYEEDDELHDDPETTQGAPTAKNFGTGGQAGTGVQPKTNLGPTSQLGQGPDQNVCPGTFQTKVTNPGVPAPATPIYDSVAKRNIGTHHNVNPGQFKDTSGQQDHSAPRYDTDQGDSAGQFNAALGKHSGVDQNAPKNRPQDVSPANYKGVESAAPRHDTDQGDSAGQFKGTMGEHLDVDQDAPKNGPQDVSPANYGTKATNPAGTGTEEAGVAPILKSFGKMDIYDEPQHKKEPTTTGSHDKFSLTSDGSSNSTIPESYNASTENQPQDMNVDEPAKQQSGYTGTNSSVPSAITDKVNSAKKEPTTTGSQDQFSPTSDSSSNKSSTIPENTPVPESVDASTENHPQDMNVDETAKQRSGYTGTIASVTTAITAAKNVVASKIGYGGTNDNGAGSQMNKEGEDVVDNGAGSQMNKEGEDVVSAGVPMASTESVRGPAGQQSSYADKICSATSAFTGKAVSAKNVVASKLGYGENNNPSSPTASEISKGTSTSPTAAEMNTGGENAESGGVTGYGRQISSTVTDKLAPVYGKVAGVGSAVVSKLPGTGTYKNAGTGSDMDRGTGVPVETGSGVGGTTGKGGGVQGYISEKMKPGEEHKALSDIIFGALHKRGKGVDEEEKKAMGEVASDGVHKRDNDDEMEIENKPMGKVTESEEVANRLGSSESEKLGKIPTSETSPKTGVVDKVKGALTNWFGKGGETNPSQVFNDQSPSDASEKQDTSTFGSSNNDDSQDGERRLQESTN